MFEDVPFARVLKVFHFNAEWEVTSRFFAREIFEEGRFPMLAYCWAMCGFYLYTGRAMVSTVVGRMWIGTLREL